MKTGAYLKSAFLMLIAFFTFSQVNAQELNETMKNLSQEAAAAYISPMTNGFGANLNTGWVTRSPEAEIFGIDIQLGLVAMGAFMNDENRTFATSGTFRFSKDQARELVGGNAPDNVITQISQEDFTVSFQGPTVVGSKLDSLQIIIGSDRNIQGYELKGRKVTLPVTGILDNLSMLPLAAPQLTLGTVYGTQLSFRYLPTVQIDEEVGDLNYFGFGIQHNPGMWIPVPLPLNVSVGFFTQNLQIGDLFESSASEFGVYASKTFGPGMLNITPYAGLSYQSSSMSAKYDYTYNYTTPSGSVEERTERISFDADGGNTAKLTLGAALKLGFINLNVDYNVAKYSTLGIGAGFIF